MGFVVPSTRSPRYGATYQLAISPWQDLAGNPGAPLGTLVTVPLPPLFAEDGFEGPATTVGGAQIVDASMLPPITGSQSALVKPNYGRVEGSRLTVRLPVQPGSQVVRLDVRALSANQTPPPVEVPLPSGVVSEVLFDMDTPMTLAPGLGGTVSTGARSYLVDNLRIE